MLSASLNKTFLSLSPISLSEWSFTICQTPYNHKNVLSVSLNKTFPSFLPYLPLYYPWEALWFSLKKPMSISRYVERDPPPPPYPAGWWVKAKLLQMKRAVPSATHPELQERGVLFNDALNAFYLRLYGIRHMVKDHSDSEKGNPLPPHMLLLSINSKGSFICTIPQTG